MPNKLGIAFLGMVVGGAAFLMSGVTVYLTTAQLQDRVRAAKLQDRVIQAQGPVQPTLVQYARFQPSRWSIGFLLMVLTERPVREAWDADGGTALKAASPPRCGWSKWKELKLIVVTRPSAYGSLETPGPAKIEQSC
jgi:hypothetical protein